MLSSHPNKVTSEDNEQQLSLHSLPCWSPCPHLAELEAETGAVCGFTALSCLQAQALGVFLSELALRASQRCSVYRADSEAARCASQSFTSAWLL